MLKTLVKSVREYKTLSVICPILMAFEVAMDIMIPFIMTFVIGEIEKLAQNPAYTIRPFKLAALFLALLACALFALFFGVMGGRAAAKASCGFTYNLREDLYGKIQSFSFFNIDHFSIASLITRITTDVTRAELRFEALLFLMMFILTEKKKGSNIKLTS